LGVVAAAAVIRVPGVDFAVVLRGGAGGVAFALEFGAGAGVVVVAGEVAAGGDLVRRGEGVEVFFVDLVAQGVEQDLLIGGAGVFAVRGPVVGQQQGVSAVLMGKVPVKAPFFT
jgi:hypothetical protein